MTAILDNSKKLPIGAIEITAKQAKKIEQENDRNPDSEGALIMANGKYYDMKNCSAEAIVLWLSNSSLVVRQTATIQ